MRERISDENMDAVRRTDIGQRTAPVGDRQISTLWQELCEAKRENRELRERIARLEEGHDRYCSTHPSTDAKS